MSATRREKFSNDLDDAELERLSILAEEMGEAIQAIGKILRHGYESNSPLLHQAREHPTNRMDLEKELGDVLCAMDMMIGEDVNGQHIDARRKEKAEKIKPYLHHQESVTP